MKSLINVKQSKKYPSLYIHKYKKEVFYKNLWNADHMLIEARGHVYTSDGKLVIAPLTKIWNRDENGTDIPRDHMCLAIEKVNGFMAAVTYVPEVDDVVISTTGSLDSDFVEYAREKIPKRFLDGVMWMGRISTNRVTFIFEIVHENDPHIISHEPGAYLIGRRGIDTSQSYFSNFSDEAELDGLSEVFGFYRPMWFVTRFSDVVDAAAKVKHEGYVVYDLDEPGKALKIKSPYYLAMKAMARCKDIFTLDKRRVDEEFYGVLDHIKNHVEPEYWESMDEQAKLDFLREYYAA